MAASGEDLLVSDKSTLKLVEGFESYVNRVVGKVPNPDESVIVDLSSTPLTIKQLFALFDKGNVDLINVTGISVTIGDNETKLDIPSSIFDTLKVLIVNPGKSSQSRALFDVSVIANCTNLERLEINDFPALMDLSAIRGLTQLRILVLKNLFSFRYLPGYDIKFPLLTTLNV